MEDTCEYCNAYKSMYWNEVDTDATQEIYLEGDGSLTITNRFGSNLWVNIPINYCPMCGRDLTPEHEN